MNLGFVGLGAMGALIVPRLMAAGHTVTGWNRTLIRVRAFRARRKLRKQFGRLIREETT